MDLRDGLAPRGIANLVWGATGKKSGELAPTTAATPAHGQAPIPSETAFLEDVFELLYTYPTLLLLAQEDRDQRSSLEALRLRSQERFGEDKTVHLVPPRNPDASEAEFFRALGRQAGMDPPAASAMDFEHYLEGRLAGGDRLFLLVGGLGKCSDAGRKRLADILRGLFDYHGDALRVVLAGDEKLAELKYAQGDLSLLSHAEPRHWPELNTKDLMDLARRARPPRELTPEEALVILDASGGHPRLIQEALLCCSKGNSIDQCIGTLAGSRQIEAQLTALGQDPADRRQLLEWLDQPDLGPYREWIQDPLLRRLYWKNLLRCEGPVGGERLVWRCPAVIEAGRRLVPLPLPRPPEPSQLRLIPTVPGGLAPGDAEPYRFLLRVENPGPADAHWLRIGQEPGPESPFLFYPPASRVKLESGDFFEVEAAVTYAASRKAPASADRTLRLRLTQAHGDPVFLDIPVHGRAPELVLATEPEKIEGDIPTLALRVRNVGEQALKEAKFRAEISGQDKPLARVTENEIPAGAEVALSFALPDDVELTSDSRLTLNARELSHPPHDWTFEDLPIRLPTPPWQLYAGLAALVLGLFVLLWYLRQYSHPLARRLATEPSVLPGLGLEKLSKARGLLKRTRRLDSVLAFNNIHLRCSIRP